MQKSMHNSYFHPRTTVLNRLNRLFKKKLVAKLQSPKAKKTPLNLMVCDLDSYKYALSLRKVCKIAK